MFTIVALVLTALAVVVLPVALVIPEKAMAYVSVEVFFAIVLVPALLASALSGARMKNKTVISPAFIKLYTQITWLSALIVLLLAAVGIFLSWSDSGSQGRAIQQASLAPLYAALMHMFVILPMATASQRQRKKYMRDANDDSALDVRSDSSTRS